MQTLAEDKYLTTIGSLKKQIFTIPHGIMVLFYILFLNFDEKLLVIFLTTFFSGIEFFYTGGHTTLQQWFTNFAGIPLCLLWPIRYITNYFPEQATGQLVNFNGYTWLVSIILFPYLIWMLEIVEGTWLKLWHDGHNPAWFYGHEDARFGGIIRLKMFIHWIGLGIAYHIVFYLTQ